MDAGSAWIVPSCCPHHPRRRRLGKGAPSAGDGRGVNFAGRGDLVIARLRARHWSAVITYRQQTIRLISVRRSRPEEVQLYEQL